MDEPRSVLRPALEPALEFSDSDLFWQEHWKKFAWGLAALVVLILAVGVEARGDEQHLRPEGFQRGQPLLLDQLAHGRPARIRGHRHVDHVRALGHRAAVGVQRMLEEAAHQDALVTGHDVLGAVAVVHVEVDDGHALQPAHVQRVARRHGHVVEEAKTHGGVARRVVAGGTNGAEGVRGAAVDHCVGGSQRGPGALQRRIGGGRAQAGVRIHRTGLAALAALLHQLAHLAHVGGGVGTGQGFVGRGRRLAMVQHQVQAGGAQQVVDGVQALGAFRVSGAHVMGAALWRGVEGGAHAPKCRAARSGFGGRRSSAGAFGTGAGPGPARQWPRGIRVRCGRWMQPLPTV